MPTPDVVTTIERILATLPRGGAGDRPDAVLPRRCARSSPSSSCPRRTTRAGCAAVEVLIATPAVRECLKDPARLAELSEAHGGRPQAARHPDLEQHLDELVEAGQITAETAKAALRPRRAGAAAHRPSRAPSRPQSA